MQVIDNEHDRLGNEPRINVPEDGNLAGGENDPLESSGTAPEWTS